MTENTEELKVPCEVYSRIVGYLRPVQDWNPGKQQEFEDRVVFDMTKAKVKEEEDDGSGSCITPDRLPRQKVQDS